MMFENEAFQVIAHEQQVLELKFDLKAESVNKFSHQVVQCLRESIAFIQTQQSVAGLLITSGKPVFCVGADINEFGAVFKTDKQNVASWNRLNSDNNLAIEQLEYPVVAVINGYALGGGLELALSADARVMANSAMVGLPEVSLGIVPGWGGTVRLPRMMNPMTAIQWIATGKPQSAKKAHEAGLVAAVADLDHLSASAKAVLQSLILQPEHVKQLRADKHSAINGGIDKEQVELFSQSLQRGADRHYPAPVAAAMLVLNAADCDYATALKMELDTFTELGFGHVSKAMAGNFISSQWVNKKAKMWAKKSNSSVSQALVLGAGIMGGGIAYQTAVKGMSVKMKDIAQAGLDQGMTEAAQLLDRQVAHGRMNDEEKVQVLSRIEPMLEYQQMEQPDLVIEAVIENTKIKQSVLAEVEQQLRPDTVLASNTSSIQITELASVLQRPENFCGMHFFNPVHAMPLVEIIRGEKTSDQAVARTVAYANALGKTAIVVNDCAGFLVNRVLFPYLQAFNTLLRDGAKIGEVDNAMEKWGWPMGPAYLNDVVGIDTSVHAIEVMAGSYPNRMKETFKTALDALFSNDRLGQKNKQGFYEYSKNTDGRLIKAPSEEANAILAQAGFSQDTAMTEEEIQIRMMLPMLTEMSLALEEGIVSTAAEADQSLLYGLGFPAFRGGVLRWADSVGIQTIAAQCEQYAHLGATYQMTASLKKMVASKKGFYD